MRLIEWVNNVTKLNKATMDEFQDNIKSAIDASLPIGSGMDYFGTTAPTNYLFADGAAVSRAEYAELFEVIGTTYGSGDGSTTFNLPDKRTRVTIMTDGNDYDVGDTGGSATHTLTVDEMPSHTHVQNSHAHNEHNEVWANVTGSSPKYNTPTGSGFFYNTVSQGGRGAIQTSGTTATNQNTGGGQAHSIMQPYLVCNYIIRAK